MNGVLALHCSGSSGSQWRALGERFRVIAPNLISTTSLTGVAEPILRHLAEPVHLVGHSYGGAVALHLARTRPWLFRSLTLIEPSAFHLLHGGDAIDRRALAEITAVATQVKADLAHGDHMSGYGRFVDYWSGPGTWAAMPAERRSALAPQLGNVALEFDALIGDTSGLDDLRHLKIPTLLIQGGRTELPSRCICQRLRRALPDIQFRVVRGAGHMLPLTHRDAVNALIAAHIEGNSTVVQKEAA